MGKNISAGSYLDILSNLKPGITEIICHPGFIDSWLNENSSYNSTRIRELDMLVAIKIREYLEKNAIKLIHYGGVAYEYWKYFNEHHFTSRQCKKIFIW
jgi:chitin disaccharide deacetylase